MLCCFWKIHLTGEKNSSTTEEYKMKVSLPPLVPISPPQRQLLSSIFCISPRDVLMLIYIYIYLLKLSTNDSILYCSTLCFLIYLGELPVSVHIDYISLFNGSVELLCMDTHNLYNHHPFDRHFCYSPFFALIVLQWVFFTYIFAYIFL